MAGFGTAPTTVAEELRARLAPLLNEVAALVASPRHRFFTLRKEQVPQTAGLYVIYCEESLKTLYVGKAEVRGRPTELGMCDGLRFRIMENHLAQRGDDNFVRYIREECHLGTRAEAREQIKAKYSVHWIEVSDSQKLAWLEHLAIAALQPRLNRG